MSERDNWEARAVAIAAQLDQAASELRRLVDEFREEEESNKEEPGERPEP